MHAAYANSGFSTRSNGEVKVMYAETIFLTSTSAFLGVGLLNLGVLIPFDRVAASKGCYQPVEAKQTTLHINTIKALLYVLKMLAAVNINRYSKYLSPDIKA